MKLSWVTFRVHDLEKSVAFYTQSLGMEVAARFGDENHPIVMLGKDDAAKVELIGEPGTVVESPGSGVSIGLKTENLDALIDALKAEGHSVSGPVSPAPHVRFFFVTDPDGYTIQLM